jgi:hypothetical protein
MGFRPADAVPVRHREIFPSGLPERARSSSRMSMGTTIKFGVSFLPNDQFNEIVGSLVLLLVNL